VPQAITSLVLSSSVNPAVSGQSITFTATVAAVSPGAGTPTGNVSTANIASQGQPASPVLLPCYFSGSPSRLSFMLWPNVSGSFPGSPLGIYIERDRYSSGEENGLGVGIAALKYYNPNFFTQFVPQPSAGAVPAVASAYLTAFCGSQSVQRGSNKVNVMPIRQVWGPMRNPMIGLLCAPLGTHASLVTIPRTLYGTTRQYLAHGLPGTGYGGVCYPLNMMIYQIWE
jgi:hypothetical protein